MRNPDVPGWGLALGLAAVVGAVLALASLGGVVGVVLIAVLLVGVVALLRQFTVAERVAAERLVAAPTGEDQSGRPTDTD